MAEVHGNRTSAENTGETAIVSQGGAESGAVQPDSTEFDPDLQAIIERWPELPEAVKASIAAMVASVDE